MAVYKRYKGKRVKHGSKDYNKATWVAEGTRGGQYYKEALKDAKTLKDAEIAEDEIIAKIRAGEYSFHKDSTTFSDYVEHIYEPRVRVNNISWKRNKQYQLVRLKNHFGKFKLKQITRPMCEDYRERRREETVPCQKCANVAPDCYRCRGENARYKPPCFMCRKRLADLAEHRASCRPAKVSNATVNRDLVTLSDIFTDACIDKKIKENPMQYVKLLPEAEPRSRILSPAEKDRLFAVLSNHKISEPMRRMRALILIACTTSWREGRIMGLEKEHLNYENYSVWVRSSKQDKAKIAPVSRVTWAVLEDLAARVESGPLFRSSRDGAPLRNFPKDSWKKLLELAEIKNLTFHDLRHQAATDLYQLGAKLFGIQNALGHAQITTTQRYVAIPDESLRNDLEALGDVYENYLN